MLKIFNSIVIPACQFVIIKPKEAPNLWFAGKSHGFDPNLKIDSVEQKLWAASTLR
jgi:hypothetical protein